MVGVFERFPQSAQKCADGVSEVNPKSHAVSLKCCDLKCDAARYLCRRTVILVAVNGSGGTVG